MLSTGKRPRQLHWYHAGPMLFGDWGTSRLYVLGICFYHTRHASLWFMLAMSLLLLAVGWSYSIVCRLYPDGGGVYSSAKHKSQFLAVVGALLLCADYVVTASLSALDAFHYLDVPYPALCAAASIAIVGAINIFGPTKSGLAALVAALLTILFSSIVGLAAAPSVGDVTVTAPAGSPGAWWSQFTAIILAISGVEAIANMTGIMVEPVARTARRSIWPVLIEIVVLNLVLTAAMQAVPLSVLGNGDPEAAYTAHRDDMLRLLAEYYVAPWFGAIAAVVFAMLLLSAVNTAVTDLVSIQYMMAHDRELPAWVAKLNAFGMPQWALLAATIVPVITVLLAPDVGHLADLYAIGVVGAVTVNLGTCAISFDLPIGKWERIGMSVLSVLMAGIWVTIAYEKPHALMFAGSIVALGLSVRWVTRNRAVLGRVWKGAEQFWAVVSEAPIEENIVDEVAGSYTPTARFLTASRGNPKLLKFALENAKEHKAELIFLYIRQVAVAVLGPALQEGPDAEALALFARIRQQAEAEGVPIKLIYTVTDNIADAILDFSATLGVERVILGATQRGALWRTMKGDIIQGVAQHLPERTTLLICA
ncbi:MAG TPA: amino acid permease [Planctomycetaceae bacterium]|nr:amino acid permease [Planctomycetaceae bacterium]